MPLGSKKTPITFSEINCCDTKFCCKPRQFRSYGSISKSKHTSITVGISAVVSGNRVPRVSAAGPIPRMPSTFWKSTTAVATPIDYVIAAVPMPNVSKSTDLLFPSLRDSIKRLLTFYTLETSSSIIYRDSVAGYLAGLSALISLP